MEWLCRLMIAVPRSRIDAPACGAFTPRGVPSAGGVEDESARNAAFYRRRCEKTRVNSRLTG